MRDYALDDFARALTTLGVQAGDTLLVHSSLISLGRLKGVPGERVAQALVDEVLRCVGPQGTLVVPCFNFDFCKGLPFSRQESPGQQMGAFNECVRRQIGAIRSRHPLQSVAAIGARAEELASEDPPSGYGEGSAFAKLVDWDARLLLMGCDTRAASLIHLVEERVQVPYRMWKSFTAPYLDGQVQRTATYQMYVRRLDQPTEVDEGQIMDWVAGHLRSVPLGGDALRMISCAAFVRECESRLRAQPNILLRHKS